MRPLKRPMFRTGGPIGEGIMHGMNGLQNGGTVRHMNGLANGGMPNNQGPRRAALVGNPIFPVGPDGRTGHVRNYILGGIWNAGKSALPKLKNFYQAGKRAVTKPFGSYVSRQSPGGKMLGLRPVEQWKANKFGSWLAKDPLIQAGMNQKGRLGKALNWGYKGLKGAVTTPSGIIGSGMIFGDLGPGGKPFGPDKYLPNIFGQRFDEDGKKVDGPLFGKLPPKVLKKTADNKRTSLLKTGDAPKELTTAEKEAKDKERLNKIYKLLGVDKAKSNAASKALIDVSRYIDEGGKDTVSKKNIGSTISKAIGAFDKRLDKVDQLKEAAGLMVAKSYLEGGDKALDREYKQVMIDAKKKEMDPDFKDLVAVYTKSNIDDPVGAAATKKFGSSYGGPLMSTKEFNKQMKAFEGEQLEEQTILDIATNAITQLEAASEEQEKVPNGYYKVGESIVLVKEGKAESLVG